MPIHYEKIDGWFDYADLYDEVIRRAAAVSNFHAVEVGCWKGRSACYMAEAMKENNIHLKMRFDCVDIFKGFPQWYNDYTGNPNELIEILSTFVQNLKDANVLTCINLIQLSTFSAVNIYANESLDFVFLDNNHEGDHVLNELRAWWPKIKPGGSLSGHDYSPEHDVPAAVEKFMFECPGQLRVASTRCFEIVKPLI